MYPSLSQRITSFYNTRSSVVFVTSNDTISSFHPNAILHPSNLLPVATNQHCVASTHALKLEGWYSPKKYALFFCSFIQISCFDHIELHTNTTLDARCDTTPCRQRTVLWGITTPCFFVFSSVMYDPTWCAVIAGGVPNTRSASLPFVGMSKVHRR